MGKVRGFCLGITFFLCNLFLALSSVAVNYSSTTSVTISTTSIWSDSLGNHPADFTHPNDIFTIEAGHTLQGDWNCHSSVWLIVKGVWNNASGTIGSIVISQGGAVNQSGRLLVYGNWNQNSTCKANCDSCTVTFSGNFNQFISSDNSTEINFKQIILKQTSGFNLFVKANITVNQDLIFNSASLINVYPGFFVKVQGIVNYPFTTNAFYLLADSNASGSLLYDNGIVKGKTNSFVRGGKLGTEPAIKHFVSTSVKDQKGAQLIDNMLGNYNVYQFSSGSYLRIFSADPLFPGEGYNVAYNGNKQIAYEGAFVNDSVKVVLYNSNTWTLVGNPYPCSIDGAAFLTEKQNMTNLSGVIYLYEQSEYNNYDDYILVNLSGQLSKVKGNYPSANIARSQGFWVQNTANNLSQCVFPNPMKTTGSSKLYAGGIDDISRCFLGLENQNGYFNKQLIAFSDKAGKYYDKLYDAFSVGDSTKSPLSFYSLIEGNKNSFEIQGLNFNTDTTTIKLGFYSTVSGQLTLSLEKLTLFPDSLKLYLLDRQLNVLTNLKQTNKYVFNSAAGRFNNRFKILIFLDTTNSIESSYRSPNIWILRGNDLEINTQSEKKIG